MNKRPRLARYEIRPSLIPHAGLGVFATRLIPRQTLIGIYSGALLNESEKLARGERTEYLLDVHAFVDDDSAFTESFYIDGERCDMGRLNHADRGTHGCNLECVFNMRACSCEFWTLRQVSEGEEMRFCYADDYAPPSVEELRRREEIRTAYSMELPTFRSNGSREAFAAYHNFHDEFCRCGSRFPWRSKDFYIYPHGEPCEGWCNCTLNYMQRYQFIRADGPAFSNREPPRIKDIKLCTHCLGYQRRILQEMWAVMFPEEIRPIKML